MTHTYKQIHTHPHIWSFFRKIQVYCFHANSAFFLKNKIFREGSIHALTTSGNGPQLTYMYIKYPKYTPAMIYGTYVPQVKRLIYIMVNYYEHKFTEMKAHICIIVCYTKLAVLFCHFYRQFQTRFRRDYKTENV